MNNHFWLTISIVSTIIGAAIFIAVLGTQRFDSYQQRCEAIGGIVVKAYGGGICIKAERLHP